ncbi:MAG: nitroreductase family protein [Thermoanaerobaculia bacterium]
MRSEPEPAFGTAEHEERYRILMEVVADRKTSRAFAPCEIPRRHYEMILDAARHGPSGANSQPWHFIVVEDPEIKARITELLVSEQRSRADLRMKFPTPNYRFVATAPGFVMVATDFRLVRAFPVLRDPAVAAESPDKAAMYRANAERILLQSVAAATMSAHLAAAALGYGVWWITAIGQEAIQSEIKPLLGVPDELALVDIMLFGPPLKPPYKRWKRSLEEIVNWGRFDPAHQMSDEDIEAWIRDKRHKVMYRDESNVD